MVEPKCYGSYTGAIRVHASGGSNSYNYSWLKGGNTDSLTNVPVGTYTVTITDKSANACYISNNITLNQPSILSIDS
jgi:hypothetical protein